MDSRAADVDGQSDDEVAVGKSAAVGSSCKFVKYDKMGEDSGTTSSLISTTFKDRYIVTEKVHGANFSIIISKPAAGQHDICFAKRTGILGGVENAEDFYSCRTSGLLKKLAQPAKRVYDDLETSLGAELVTLQIYGELFGGKYPHPDVPADAKLEPVQMGVWYSPGLEFQAFDVAIVSASSRRFLNYGDASRACERGGILFALPLLEGTLNECLEFPIEFATTIPGRLGLPDISAAPDGSANVAEGVVVRPAVEPASASQSSKKDSGNKVSSRGLFKRKIEAFSEKKYRNDDWKKGKNGGAGYCDVCQEELVRYELEACITEARLANVLSKIGRVDPGDSSAREQVINDFQADVCDALEEADRGCLLQSGALQALLRTQVQDLLEAALVRPVLRRDLSRDYSSTGASKYDEATLDAWQKHRDAANAAARKKDWQQVVDEAQAAVRLRPDWAQGYSGIKLALDKLGRAAELDALLPQGLTC